MEKNANNKTVALIILDGWGYREELKDNAVAAAKTPNFDNLWRKYPHTLLEASGLAVGLPVGQMGNSEVGHTTIGAGSVLDTDLVRIGKAIDNGEFVQNPAFQTLFKHVKVNNSTLHVMGLLSPGGVHSHQDHLFAFLSAAKAAGLDRVAVHVFTDGRDTPPQSAVESIRELEDVLNKVGIGFIATIAGRFFAMDRDKNWDRLAKFEQALFKCEGNVCEIEKPSEFVAELYKTGTLDELLPPIVCPTPDGFGCEVKDNDAIFCFNFRPDRARQLIEKVLTQTKDKNVCLATMTDYGTEFSCPAAFPPIKIETTLAAEISRANLTQAHIAETEKFPHATYFLNGGREEPWPGERHIMLASRKDVQTHDLAPKMRAEGIADKAIEEIATGTDFIFINFANPDMVGHTANVPAIIEAVEETDLQLGRVITALTEKNGVAFITADHGNAEVNRDEITGDKHTSHTINPVPAIITKENLTIQRGGGLADIAPTILSLLNIPKPEQMTGHNLIV